MSFADLELRTNTAVMGRLSNARATKAGSLQEFPVIFDRTFVETATGATATTPVAAAADSDISDLVPHSSQLTIKGVLYTLRDVHPDGTGLSLLVLEVA